MIWHILILESVSVYGRYVVGLLSVWVRDCWSAVGCNASIVLMIGFQSVSGRLSVGLKSGDSIPNLTRNSPDMNPTGFTVSSAKLSVADSWPMHWKFCVFCRFRVGSAGVTGVSGTCHMTSLMTSQHWFRQWSGAISMMTSSNEPIFCVSSPLWGESTSHQWIPLTNASFDVIFDLCLSKQLSKQSRHQWFEKPLHSLQCHCNEAASHCLNQCWPTSFIVTSPLVNQWLFPLLVTAKSQSHPMGENVTL